MSDWSSYRLGDFLMFTPRTYARLFERYNAEVWPLHVVAFVMGIAIVVLALRKQHPRVIHALLAIAWLWVAWAFFWERYSTIHTYAKWFAVAFAVEALLWIAAALPLSKAAALPPHSEIFAIILILYPILSPYRELFAIAPDPTALGTLAIIGKRWYLYPIPVLWLLMSLVTHLALASR